MSLLSFKSPWLALVVAWAIPEIGNAAAPELSSASVIVNSGQQVGHFRGPEWAGPPRVNGGHAWAGPPSSTRPSLTSSPHGLVFSWLTFPVFAILVRTV